MSGCNGNGTGNGGEDEKYEASIKTCESEFNKKGIILEDIAAAESDSESDQEAQHAQQVQQEQPSPDPELDRGPVSQSSRLASVKERSSLCIPSAKNFSKRNVQNYRLYKPLTDSGKHASKIHLMMYRNDYLVKKVYPRSLENIFYNEVYWVIKLSGTGFTPRLVRVDPTKLVFWMTYCGKPLPKPEWRGETRREILRMQSLLETEYGVYHNDIKEGNITRDRRGRLYMIDFGWTAPYPLDPGYGEGRWGRTHPDCFEEMKPKCIQMLQRKREIQPSIPSIRDRAILR